MLATDAERHAVSQAAVVAELRGLGYEVTDPKPTSPGRLQAFISDPWGNGIELHQHDH